LIHKFFHKFHCCNSSVYLSLTGESLEQKLREVIVGVTAVTDILYQWCSCSAKLVELFGRAL
jgi:hypothetical protein